jgi:predicted nuclease with TOPRIM domain
MTRDDDVQILRRERDEAIAHARRLEHELGEQRGRVKRLELMMSRRKTWRQRVDAMVRRLRGILEH